MLSAFVLNTTVLTTATMTFTYLVVAICLLFVAHLGEASISKIIARETPGWFVDQFSDTWLGRGPLGLMWWSIALAELLATGLFIGGIVQSLGVSEIGSLVYAAIALTVLIFAGLGFGLRVACDFVGSANAFFYGVLTGLVGIGLYIFKFVLANHEILAAHGDHL